MRHASRRVMKRARYVAFAGLLTAALIGACRGENPESDALADGALGKGDSAAAESALAAGARRELAAAGFTADEIQAVADSVSISKLLSVQSFVKEANDGELHEGGSVRRESHGKHQGCLRARVDVTTSANVGVFQQGKSYPAWIRLSNGGAYQKDDKSQHISRGWGIKLLGVDSTASRTHDFLFITSPRFFINDVRHYPGFLRASGNGRLGFLWNMFTNMSSEERDVIFHRLGLSVANLLESPEYSAVPYRFGADVVKYALAPCGSTPPTTPESRAVPSDASENYLEDAMNASLRTSRPSEGICYSFFVQRARSEQEDPVDNPTRAWGGRFEQIATIVIPHGQHKGGPADYRNNDALCEQLAFEPWNAADESLPLGKTNWTRRYVYAALNNFRRVEMPAIIAKWSRDPNDASIPSEFRSELSRLKVADPSAITPKVQSTVEPSIDDGFRALGIAR